MTEVNGYSNWDTWEVSLEIAQDLEAMAERDRIVARSDRWSTAAREFKEAYLQVVSLPDEVDPDAVEWDEIVDVSDEVPYMEEEEE